jgi:hypothetical protein
MVLKSGSGFLEESKEGLGKYWDFLIRNQFVRINWVVPLWCLSLCNICFNKMLKKQNKALYRTNDFTQGLPVYEWAVMEFRQMLDALATRINRIQLMLSWSFQVIKLTTHLQLQYNWITKNMSILTQQEAVFSSAAPGLEQHLNYT